MPGERTFFLQARGSGRLVSVVLEKVQVTLLAQKLEELLAEAHRRFGVEVPEEQEGIDDNEPWRRPRRGVPGGHARLSWDGDTGTVVIEAIAVGEYEADEPTEAELATLDRLRVRLTPGGGACSSPGPSGWSPPAAAVPLCGQPLDPGGHRGPGTTGTAADLGADVVRLLSDGAMEIEGAGRRSNVPSAPCSAWTGDRRCVYKPSAVSDPCGTSPTEPWPAGRWPRTRVRGDRVGLGAADDPA